MHASYGGTRVFWSGTMLLRSEDKTPIEIPTNILKMLPRFPFEGEIVFEGDNSNWNNAKIYAFDAPRMQDQTYTTRIKNLYASIQLT
jgi:hypothetical protein